MDATRKGGASTLENALTLSCQVTLDAPIRPRFRRPSTKPITQDACFVLDTYTGLLKLRASTMNNAQKKKVAFFFLIDKQWHTVMVIAQNSQLNNRKVNEFFDIFLQVTLYHPQK